jgi:hypothetical protein
VNIKPMRKFEFLRCALVVIIPFVLLVGCASTQYPPLETYFGVRFENYTRATFSEKEKQTILQLAGECGLSNIDHVRIDYMLPTAQMAIGVRSKEIVNGRDASHRMIFISRGRSRGLQQNSKMPSANGFFVTQNNEVKQRIVRTDAAEFRLRMEDSIPIEIADDIVTRFFRKNLRFRHDSDSHWLEEDIRSSAPVALSRDGEMGFRLEFFKNASGRIYRFERDAADGSISVTSVGFINI